LIADVKRAADIPGSAVIFEVLDALVDASESALREQAAALLAQVHDQRGVDHHAVDGSVMRGRKRLLALLMLVFGGLMLVQFALTTGPLGTYAPEHHTSGRPDGPSVVDAIPPPPPPPAEQDAAMGDGGAGTGMEHQLAVDPRLALTSLRGGWLSWRSPPTLELGGFGHVVVAIGVDEPDVVEGGGPGQNADAPRPARRVDMSALMRCHEPGYWIAQRAAKRIRVRAPKRIALVRPSGSSPGARADHPGAAIWIAPVRPSGSDVSARRGPS